MSTVPRRRFLAQLAGAGVITPALTFPEILWTKLQETELAEITSEMVLDAAQLANLEMTAEKAAAMVEEMTENLARYRELQEEPLGNEVALPLHFNPQVPGVEVDRTPRPIQTSKPIVERPTNLEDISFWPLTHLAHLLETLSLIHISRCRREI